MLPLHRKYTTKMFLLAFFLLFIQWMIFSGRFDWFHLGLGAVSCLFLAYTTQDLIFRDEKRTLRIRIREFVRFPIYTIWLIGQVVQANFYLLYLVFHPRMKDLIDPEILELDGSMLENDFARIVLAQSITLTPGTITLSIEHKKLTVYTINSKTSAGLGTMLKKVAWVFNNQKGAL